jgi:hypothetical protein
MLAKEGGRGNLSKGHLSLGVSDDGEAEADLRQLVDANNEPLRSVISNHRTWNGRERKQTNSLIHSSWLLSSLHETPMTFTLRASKSFCLRATSPSSVVQTGVKSL